MAQINLHITPEFEADLRALMGWRGIGSKSAAIRFAVRMASLRRRLAECRNVPALQTFVQDLPPGTFSPPNGAAVAHEIMRRAEELVAEEDRLSGTPPAP